MHIRHLLLAGLGATVLPCAAQERATCLFSEGFDGPGFPSGWEIGAQVEQQDADGNGLGTFVDAWRVENAAATNTGEVIHVPDVPAGNSFAVANDDASPCNCNMQDVILTSPAIDLSGQSHARVSFHAFNDGLFGGGDAWLEASSDNNAWSTVRSIPEVAGAWQNLVADLDAYAGGTAYLRFRWSDNGNWATGFAIDNVCVSAPAAKDLTLLQAFLGDPTVSAFDEGAHSLGYTRIPEEQSRPLRLAVYVRNNGYEALNNVNAHVTITLNATQVEQDTVLITQLGAMEEVQVSWDTEWTPGEAGDVSVSVSLSHADADNDPADDDASLSYRITSNAEGSPMALDNDLPTAMVGGSGTVFSVNCRYELVAGGSIVGIGARLGVGTSPGTTVHAVLLNGQLEVLAESAEHTITDEDLALSFAGGLLYLPLEEAVDITEERDVFAQVRMDNGTLYVGATGAAPPGSALKINSDLTIDLLDNTPIIRPFFAGPITGITEQPTTELALTIAAGAVPGTVQLLGLNGPVLRYEVMDGAGRPMARGTGATVNTNGWSTGTYIVRAWSNGGFRTGRFVVLQ